MSTPGRCPPIGSLRDLKDYVPPDPLRADRFSVLEEYLCRFRNQIRADAIGLPLVSLQEAEATSLGTAVFCRCAIDPSTTIASTAASWRRQKARWLPKPENVEAYRAPIARFVEAIRLLDGWFRNPA